MFVGMLSHVSGKHAYVLSFLFFIPVCVVLCSRNGAGCSWDSRLNYVVHSYPPKNLFAGPLHIIFLQLKERMIVLGSHI